MKASSDINEAPKMSGPQARLVSLDLKIDEGKLRNGQISSTSYIS